MTSRCNDTRRILGYCRAALDEIKKEEPTGEVWERRWASLMALLRTACEMLKRESPKWWCEHTVKPNKLAKKDSRNPKNAWKPDIYGKFIWTDSNLFLHQGKLTTGQSVGVFITGVSAQALAAGERPRPVPAPDPLRKAEISYHMNTGSYARCDPRDVADTAISWIQEQIEAAER